jgi:hypothetical protein
VLANGSSVRYGPVQDESERQLVTTLMSAIGPKRTWQATALSFSIVTFDVGQTNFELVF